MNLLFFLIYFTLVCALAAWISIRGFLFLIYKRRQELIQCCLTELHRARMLARLVEKMDIQSSVEEIADSRLDALVENFKGKVPMIGIFLSGDLEKNLKGIAKEELLRMIPELKEHFVQKIQNSPQSSKEIEKDLTSVNWLSIFAKQFAQIELAIVTLAAGFGLLTSLGWIIFHK